MDVLTCKFGCVLPQDSSDFNRVVEVATLCEKLGYDSVWAFDHLAPYWTKSGAGLECWTTLSSLASYAKKVKIGSLVTNVTLRHPSILAKIVSTLDEISDGRVILGLGTGDRLSSHELNSYGYPFLSLDERVLCLRETVQILKGLWTSHDFTFNGEVFQLSHARLEPKPLQEPHPPIWIGGKHNKIIDVLAELADGWTYWNPTRGTLLDRTNYLRKRCLHYDRSFDNIVRSWSGIVSYSQSVDGMLTYLREQSDNGTDYFIAYFGNETRQEAYERFADSVRSL